MGVKRGFLLCSRNINYKCLKAKEHKKTFGPKKDKEVQQFRILHNVELGDLCSSAGIFRTE
jgi:hypothetical protein